MMLFKKKSSAGDFPNLGVTYLDSACMSLRPKQVIDKISEYYLKYPACSGRSNHALSRKLDLELLEARKKIANFIGTKNPKEIIITKNTTEGMNLIANTIDFKKGDVVVTTDKEHNSNLIPWIKLVNEKGIKHIPIPSNEDNTFNLEAYKIILEEEKNIKLVSVVHVSNIDGVTNPLKEITQIAHEKNILVLADGAQATPHKQINVTELDVDFYAFSGHKMLGPSGIGVLYGKEALLKELPQFIVGGETVKESTYASYDVEDLPEKFEGGLQDYAGILGLGEACTYLQKKGLDSISSHEQKLNKIITDGLQEELDNGDLILIGPRDPSLRSGIFNVYSPTMDAHEIAQLLDKAYNVAVRSGMHCVHSWFNGRKINGSIRASLYVYNTEEEAHAFVKAMKEILRLQK